MKIGRKIYYDKATGNVILDTGEREGDVVATTIDQDFASYAALAERVRETVGAVYVTFGQDRDKFGQYLYHIDPTTESIAWDLTPIQQEEEQKQLSQQEQINQLNKRQDDTENAVLSLMDLQLL